MGMRTIKTLLLATVAAFAYPAFPLIDSWGPPRTEHWSSSRAYVVRVDDFSKTLTLRNVSGKGSAHSWQIKYPQEFRPGYPGAPNMAYVSDDGKHVVLCNVHGRLGFGKVLVFLGKDGSVASSYELSEFLSKNEILSAIHTISSIWWAEYDLHFLDESLGQFQLVTMAGTVLAFDLRTGKKIELGKTETHAIREKGIASARKLLDSDNVETRARGNRLLGLLGATAAQR
jgi:hypothetical protein